MLDIFFPEGHLSFKSCVLEQGTPSSLTNALWFPIGGQEPCFKSMVLDIEQLEWAILGESSSSPADGLFPLFL